MILKHHRAFRAGPRDLATGAQHRAAARQSEAHHQIEQRGFAAARETKKRDKHTQHNKQENVAQRMKATARGIEDHLHVNKKQKKQQKTTEKKQTTNMRAI